MYYNNFIGIRIILYNTFLCAYKHAIRPRVLWRSKKKKKRHVRQINYTYFKERRQTNYARVDIHFTHDVFCVYPRFEFNNNTSHECTQSLMSPNIFFSLYNIKRVEFKNSIHR